MDYKIEIYNVFRDDGISNFDVNKTIFGIAAIGLLIGKERLSKFAHDRRGLNDLRQFENEIYICISECPYNDQKCVLEDALGLISEEIRPKTLLRVINILLLEDLLDIVLHLDFCTDVGKSYDYPISSISCISDLVIEIFKTHGGEKIFNCDCGYGDFFTKISESVSATKITGYTFNLIRYKISKIRGYFCDKSVNVELQDMFYPPLEEKYDLIYNSYPLIYKYQSIHEIIPMLDQWNCQLKINRKYSANLLWIINALQSINENGMVVAFVADGVLFNSIDTDVRRYLIENNYIQTIISLPSGILSPYSGVKTSLIILQKNNTHNKSIKMIDATKIFTKQRRNIYLSEEDIRYIIYTYNMSIDTELSFDVPYDDLVKNDYNLGIEKYIETGYTMINPTILGDVTKCIFRGYQIKAADFDSIATTSEKATSYRMINVSDVLAEGFVKVELQPVVIEDERKYVKYFVEDGDIIITAKNTTVKTAVYKKQDYKSILTGNLIVIRVDDSKLNPYFLKAFLDSELGENMINSISTGTTVKSINPNNLKNMQISLPTLEVQAKIAEQYKKTLEEIKILLKSYSIKMEQQKKIYDDLIGN